MSTSTSDRTRPARRHGLRSTNASPVTSTADLRDPLDRVFRAEGVHATCAVTIAQHGTLLPVGRVVVSFHRGRHVLVLHPDRSTATGTWT